jgi:DNA-binding XRE family transcriptional regulator
MKNEHPLSLYRRARDLTQAEIAVALGVDQGTIANIETGKRPPSWKLAARIAKLTGIPARKLRPDMAEVFQS